MDLLKHLPSRISPSFSEALRIDTQVGCWIFVAGQVGVPLPPDKGSVTFEQEVRTSARAHPGFAQQTRCRHEPCRQHQNILTDLGPYAVFSRIRGEFFPKDPPASTAVQVAGLLLNAKIDVSTPCLPARRSRRVNAIPAQYRAGGDLFSPRNSRCLLLQAFLNRLRPRYRSARLYWRPYSTIAVIRSGVCNR